MTTISSKGPPDQLIKGCRVMAHDYEDGPLGRGTIAWLGPVYARVLMDGTGKKLVVRRDKCLILSR